MVRACEIVQEGPPQGSGHYSPDRRWWWDDSRQQWFRAVPGTDVLEIELEDYGHTSFWRSILTTLTGQYGTQAYRFVGRARSADSRWPTYALASGTFPVQPLQPPLDELDEKTAWTPEVKDRLRELQECLVEQGWRPTTMGSHWWSQVYERPGLDWDTPPEAYAAEQSATL